MSKKPRAPHSRSLSWSGPTEMEGFERWTVKVPAHKTRKDRAGREYTAYQVVVGKGDISWTVYRRFSQFHEAFQRLQACFPKVTFKFPPKKTFGNLDEQFILRRQEQLEFTLQSLLTHPNLEVRYCPELRFFLDRDYPPPAFQLSNAAIQGGLKMEVMRVMEGVSTWRTRYAVVQNHHLYIYLSPLDHSPQRIVHLDGYLRCVYSNNSSKSSTHAFQLVSRHPASWPDIHFATESPEERRDWSAALTQAMEEAHDTVLTLFAEAPPMPTIIHSTYTPGESDAEDAPADDDVSDGEGGETKPPRPSEATQGPSIVLPSRVQAVTSGAMGSARKSLNLGLGPLVIPEGEKPPPSTPAPPSGSGSRSGSRSSSRNKKRRSADAPSTPKPPAAAAAAPVPVTNIEDVPNKAVVVFAYEANTELELSLDEQAKIQILEEADDGWARVRVLTTGDVGLYPISYFEKLP